MATRKQREITNALIDRTLHGLGELGIPYAVILEDVPFLFTNVDKRIAISLLADYLDLHYKIRDNKIDKLAEPLSDDKLNPPE